MEHLIHPKFMTQVGADFSNNMSFPVNRIIIEHARYYGMRQPSDARDALSNSIVQNYITVINTINQLEQKYKDFAFISLTPMMSNFFDIMNDVEKTHDIRIQKNWQWVVLPALDVQKGKRMALFFPGHVTVESLTKYLKDSGDRREGAPLRDYNGKIIKNSGTPDTVVSVAPIPSVKDSVKTKKDSKIFIVGGVEVRVPFGKEVPANHRTPKGEAKPSYFRSLGSYKSAKDRSYDLMGKTCVKCHNVCGNTVTCDHVFPISLYPQLFRTTINMQPMCTGCNTAKGDHIREYRSNDTLKRLIKIEFKVDVREEHARVMAYAIGLNLSVQDIMKYCDVSHEQVHEIYKKYHDQLGIRLQRLDIIKSLIQGTLEVKKLTFVDRLASVKQFIVSKFHIA